MNDLIGKGWRNLPLLVLLILPIYNVPEGVMRIVQMQFFQVGAIAAFILSPKNYRPINLHFFGLLAVFALSQLLLCHIEGMNLFHIQMLVLAYLLFETIFSSGVGFKEFRAVVLFFVAVTVLFSINQATGFKIPLPRYLTEDMPFLVQGIWTGQAYCGAFCAFAMPYAISLKTRFKWLVIVGLLWVIWNTHSSFAEVAAALSILTFLFYRKRHIFLVTLLPLAAACFFHYWFFEKGDFSGELQRFFIWERTATAILKEPFIGHAFGSFQRFGIDNLMHDSNLTAFYFPTAHNEYLQVLYEAGFIGLLICLGLIARVLWITHKNNGVDSILTLGVSIGVLLLIGFGQPVFHACNIAIFAIFALAILELENFKIKKERENNVY